MNIAQLRMLVTRAMGMSLKERVAAADAGYEMRARRWERIADEADALAESYDLRRMYVKHGPTEPPTEESK